MQNQNEIIVNTLTFETIEKVKSLITNPNEKLIGMVFNNACKLHKARPTNSKRKYLIFCGIGCDIKSISTTDYETNELGEISVEIERDYRLGFDSKSKEILIVTREEKKFK
tara:strand:+ start:2033 stop:2365 length:333 start_codon:yes stop_codon:yes gene_type:complete